MEEKGGRKEDQEGLEGETGTVDGLGKLLTDLFQGVTNVGDDRDIFANFSLALDKL